MKPIPTLLLFLILSILFSNCSSGQNKVPAGKLNDEQMLIEYAVYFSENSVMDKDRVIELIKKGYAGFEIIDSIPAPGDVSGSQIVVREITNVKEDFKAPDMDFLSYSSRGLSESQKEILQHSNYVILFDFLCEENLLIPTLERASNLMLDVAQNENDIIWDSETRECFTGEFWKENRVIHNGSIDISKHVTIHVYPNNDYCRAITLGMLKFGLPDFCVENISCHSSDGMVSLINLSAQTVLEKKFIDEKGRLSIDLDLLENQELKTALINSLEEGAKKKATINIVQGNWEEGDPDNRLIEIGFSKKNPQIEHDKFLSEVFGATNEVVNLAHDDEILAASERAKQKTSELFEMFSKGMPPGQYIIMKFPFENISGEREWMWVEVVKWEKDNITGLLQNDPHIVKTLKSGQEVKKDVDEMFDYMIYHPDGTTSGNETGEIISKQRD